MKFKNLLRLFLGLFLLVTLNFILIRNLPGTPLERIDSLNPAVDKKWMQDLYLDKSLPEQYAIYLKNILRGDLGPSISFVGSSVQSLIWQHASATLLLNLLALSLVFIFASVLIWTSLIDPGSWISRMASLVSMAIISTPTILLAPILILIFSVHLGWLPPAFLSSPLHYILPAIVLSLRPSVYLARNLVNVMEAEVQKDYVRTAKAKGLNETQILFKHILKNSIVPILNYLGPLSMGLLSGSAFVEILFAVPGLGALFIESLRERDYFLSSGLVLVFGGLLMLLSFVLDELSHQVDIRLRESHEASL